MLKIIILSKLFCKISLSICHVRLYLISNSLIVGQIKRFIFWESDLFIILGSITLLTTFDLIKSSLYLSRFLCLGIKLMIILFNLLWNVAIIMFGFYGWIRCEWLFFFFIFIHFYRTLFTLVSIDKNSIFTIFFLKPWLSMSFIFTILFHILMITLLFLLFICKLIFLFIFSIFIDKLYSLMMNVCWTNLI